MRKLLLSLLISLFCISNTYCQLTSYYSDVKPIIDKHCVSCHSEGEIGPMPLNTYEEVVSYASMIKFVTESGYMPPWIADAEYSHFKNENVLAEKDIELIVKWIEDGLKEGEPETQKVLVEVSTQVESDLDLSFSMSESFEQYGIYYDQYQVFVLPVDLDEDTYVKRINFLPGNKDIVRACTISLDLAETSDSLDNWDPRYGYYHFGGIGYNPEEYVWYHWSPNKKQDAFGENVYKLLPKKCRLIMHVYYGPTGVPQVDSSGLSIEVYQNNNNKKRRKSITLFDGSNLTNPPFQILPGERKRFHEKIVLEKDITIFSVMPQSQLICNSWEIFAVSPSSTNPIKILKIPQWDFHWKRSYELIQPLTLKKGTIIHAIASYDNSEENLFNPSIPPTKIKKGYGMFDELFQVHFDILVE